MNAETSDIDRLRDLRQLVKECLGISAQLKVTGEGMRYAGASNAFLVFEYRGKSYELVLKVLE